MSRIASSGVVRQREPRVRDKEHLARVATLSCVACAVQGRSTWPVHVAHIRIGFPNEPGWREVGKAEKPSDFRVAGLCPAHHMDGPHAQHRMNERAFWVQIGIYPPAFCAALVAAFEAGDPGMGVVRLAARGGFPWP